MASLNLLSNMYDISLKPRLLRGMIRDSIPDEKHPLERPLELAHVAARLKTHRLLSESAGESTDRELVESWKSAVDAWVDRLLMLVSSNMPDKCWAGTCLLGLTCQECSSERFLASYSVWLNKLLVLLQPPEQSYFVKVASCASISDLFTRLGEFPNLKKDGTLQAAKLIPTVLKLLNDDTSVVIWEGAVCLLCTIITIFPSSVHRHYDSAEAAIVSKIMSGKCGVNMLKELGYCLALLPRTRGDEDSWALMMQKVLLAINVILNDAFEGLEQETKRNEAMRLLVPPGKDSPPPLGGQAMLGEASDHATGRPEIVLISSISTLMLCCRIMVATYYPVQVTVPVWPLLALAGRVLMVDGSLPESLFPFVTAMQQELICSELPLLHSHSLELLMATVKALHSQILPHAADIVQLVTQYFRRCALPELRIKVYSIIKLLLNSMGVGMAIHLTEEVTNNAFIDLDSNDYECVGMCFAACLNVSTEVTPQPSARKRKLVVTTGSVQEKPNIAGLEAKAMRNPARISLKISALEALEVLLTVGSPLQSENWRSNVDRLLITVAANACKAGWDKENVFLPGEPAPTWEDFQLAALRALLASLLSPAHVRPPYLAQGLQIFDRGMQETGTKISEFCAHALLVMQLLIHPRGLPLVDFPSATSNSFDGLNSRFPDDLYSGVQNQKSSFPMSTLEKGPVDPQSDDDDLYTSWLREANEVEVSLTEPEKEKNMSQNEELSEILRDPSARKLRSVDGSSRVKALEESAAGTFTAAAAAAEIQRNEEAIMVESQQFQEIVEPCEEPISHEGQMVTNAISGSKGAQLNGVVTDIGELDPIDNEMLSGKDVLTKNDGLSSIGNTSGASERSKGFMFELDNESSMDSLPDIVDHDPDSD